jgi:hypothetical protein
MEKMVNEIINNLSKATHRAKKELAAGRKRRRRNISRLPENALGKAVVQTSGNPSARASGSTSSMPRFLLFEWQK